MCVYIYIHTHTHTHGNLGANSWTTCSGSEAYDAL